MCTSGSTFHCGLSERWWTAELVRVGPVWTRPGSSNTHTTTHNMVCLNTQTHTAVSVMRSWVIKLFPGKTSTFLWCLKEVYWWRNELKCDEAASDVRNTKSLLFSDRIRFKNILRFWECIKSLLLFQKEDSNLFLCSWRLSGAEWISGFVVPSACGSGLKSFLERFTSTCSHLVLTFSGCFWPVLTCCVMF